MEGIIEQLPLRILRVDPNTEIQELMRLHTDRFRPKVYTDTAHTMEEAVQKFEDNSYDAIVSEYSVGDNNGLELLQKVREISDIPFIIHSRFYSRILVEKAEDKGVTAFRKKRYSDRYYLSLLRTIEQKAGPERSAEIDFRPDIFCVYNWQGQLVKHNPAFMETLGHDSVEAKKNIANVFDDKKESEIWEIMMGAVSSEAHAEAAINTSEALVNYDIKAEGVQKDPETRIAIAGISREELMYIEPQKADFVEIDSQEPTEIKS